MEHLVLFTLFLFQTTLFVGLTHTPKNTPVRFDQKVVS